MKSDKKVNNMKVHRSITIRYELLDNDKGLRHFQIITDGLDPQIYYSEINVEDLRDEGKRVYIALRNERKVQPKFMKTAKLHYGYYDDNNEWVEMTKAKWDLMQSKNEENKE